jgi:hypothetical protein
LLSFRHHLPLLVAFLVPSFRFCIHHRFIRSPGCGGPNGLEECPSCTKALTAVKDSERRCHPEDVLISYQLYSQPQASRQQIVDPRPPHCRKMVSEATDFIGE